MLKSFHIDITRLGLISSVYFLASIMSLIPAGILLDRYSTRTLILIAMSTTVGSITLFALAPTPWIALSARFIAGISGAFCFISTIRLATRWFPPEKLAQVTGLVVAFGMLGGIMAQTPLCLLVEQIGWRPATLGVALSGLCLLLVVYRTVIDYPPGYRLDESNKMVDTKPQSLRATLTNIQNWLTGCYISLMNLPIFILGAMWGALFLTQAYGLTSTQASKVSSMLFVGMIVGSPCMGWLSDKIKRRQLPLIFFSFMMLFPLGALVLTSYLSFFSLIITFFAIGFFCSAHIIGYSQIAESNPKSAIATAEGLASTLMIAGGLTQGLFAWILQSHGSGTLIAGVTVYSKFDFNAAISLMIIAAIIAIAISLLIKETYGKEYNEKNC
jgi:MFS family permease